MAAVVLDPFVIQIPSQIKNKLDVVFEYIRNKIDYYNETSSPPIKKTDESSLDHVEKKYCQTPDIVYYEYDKLTHWFEKIRPNESRHNNHYKYWKDHDGHQQLRKFAMKLFIHAGSSIACERFFSLCSNMADDKRTSITPENFSALCVVKANISRARKLLFDDDL